MCEPSVYLLRNGEECLLLEGLDALEVDGKKVLIRSLFGEQKTVQAKVKSLSLVDHKVLLEPVAD